MKNLHAPDSFLDLISFLKREERRELWSQIKSQAFKRNRAKREKRLKREKSEASSGDAENWGKAIEGVCNLFRGTKDAVSRFVTSKPTSPKETLAASFANLSVGTYVVSETAQKALHDFADAALGEKLEQFKLAQKWTQHARDESFIGPLTAEFEAYRKDKDITLLHRVFEEHAACLAEHGIGYLIEEDQMIFPEEIVQRIIEENPLHESETGSFVLVFREQVQPEPTKLGQSFNGLIQNAARRLEWVWSAPAYVYA